MIVRIAWLLGFRRRNAWGMAVFMLLASRLLASGEDRPAQRGREADKPAAMRQWLTGSLPGEAPPGAAPAHGLVESVPFSFTYGGKPSSQLLGHWKRKETQQPPADDRQRHVLTWADEQTGLEITCEAVLFSDFPAVEWLFA